jgi:rubrerythrin
MEKGDIAYAYMASWTGVVFKSRETKMLHGLASKETSVTAYSCKVCGYIEIYRNLG